MMNITILLLIVLVILSVSAVNFLGDKVPDVYGSFGLGMYTVRNGRCFYHIHGTVKTTIIPSVCQLCSGTKA